MLFRRAPQKVEELKIVIVGAGEVGFHIAQRLSEEQKQVVVIDQNPDKLRRIEDNMDVQTVLGSAPSHRFSRMRGRATPLFFWP